MGCDKEARHIKVWMYVGIERFGIDGDDSRTIEPRDTKVFARRSVWCEGKHLPGGQTFAREIVLQPLARRGGESVDRDPRRMAHRTEKQRSEDRGQRVCAGPFLIAYRCPLPADDVF